MKKIEITETIILEHIKSMVSHGMSVNKQLIKEVEQQTGKKLVDYPNAYNSNAVQWQNA